MTVLYVGEIHVGYAAIAVTPEGGGRPGNFHAGQVNGLCGAAVPGRLHLITGRHTGWVPLVVEFLDTAPPIDDGWEEVVEVSFHTPTTNLYIGGVTSEIRELPLPAAGDLRVRYCATGLDAAHAGDFTAERYLLQFWPARPAADAIVRQTSTTAAYRHDVARRTPPPPRTAREAQQQREQAVIDAVWGGQAPSARLRTTGPRGAQVAAADRDLAEAVAGRDPTTQRAIAIWSARHACAALPPHDLPGAADALDALAAGRPVSPPYDDRDRLWEVLMNITGRIVALPADPHGRPGLHPKAVAADALGEALDPDPGRAAMGTIAAALTGRDWAAFRDRLNQAFDLGGARH